MKKADGTAAIINVPRNALLIAALREKGTELILLPETVYAATAGSESTKALIGTALEFDWIVFTDPVNAGAFPGEFASLGKDIYELDAVSIFAAGEAVADQLRFRQIHSDLIEPAFGANAAIEHIREFLLADDLEGINLLFAGLDFEDSEPEKLAESLGARANRVTPRSPVIRQIEKLRFRTLIESGSVDHLVLGGAQDLFDLLAVFGRDVLSRLLSAIRVNTHGDADEMFALLRK